MHRNETLNRERKTNRFALSLRAIFILVALTAIICRFALPSELTITCTDNSYLKTGDIVDVFSIPDGNNDCGFELTRITSNVTVVSRNKSGVFTIKVRLLNRIALWTNSKKIMLDKNPDNEDVIYVD